MLLRYPGLFASLAAGALLLSVAAAVYPLFLSASATKLVRTQTDQPLVTRFGTGMLYRNGTLPVPGGRPSGSAPPGSPFENRIPNSNIVRKIDATFRRITADPNLGSVLASTLGPVVQVSEDGGAGDARSARLFTGQAARSNVTLVAGGGAGGAWVPDLVADALHLAPGDTIEVTSQSGRRVELRVTGVFEGLYKGTPAGYWHPWYDDLVLYCATCAPPPQPLLVPTDRFEGLARGLGIDRAAYAWEAPARPELTLEEARSVAEHAAAIEASIKEPGTTANRLFGRCVSFFCGLRNGPAFSSGMTEVVRDVERRLTTIDGPARLLRAAGLLVALVVVGAAGAFSLSARRVEATLLDARGFGPWSIAARAALESLAPCVLGGAAGLGLSIAIVAWAGPGRVSGPAQDQALRGGAAAIAAAIVVIGLVSAAAFAFHPSRDRPRRGIARSIPWELALAGASIWVLAQLRSGGAFEVNAATGAPTPSVLLLVFPVLSLAGFATLVARAFAASTRWARSRSSRLGSGPFLAVHRLAGAPGLTLLLVGASALCLGLFVQSAAVASSVAETVHAKAEVFVGSDVQARIEYRNTVPDGLPVPFTRVTRRLEAGTLSAPGSSAVVPFDLLAIDPATFEGAAYWNPAFAERPLAQLIAPLDGPATPSIPVVVAGAPNAAPTSIAIDQLHLPVVVVGHADSFPGVSSYRPLLVVDEATLLAAVGDAPNPLDEVGAQTELWLHAAPERARDALAAGLPYQPDLVISAEEVEDIPYIAATIDTFQVMNGLGLAAALLVIVAMLMYLQARQRSQVVSYGLSLRMGMPTAGHRRALVAELSSMLGVALVAGAGLAYLAARLLVPLLDPLPTIPPDPLFHPPLGAIALSVPVVAIVALGGGWLTELRARRSDLGQVMRLAD